MSLKTRSIRLNTLQRSRDTSRLFIMFIIVGCCLGLYCFTWFSAVPEYFGAAAVPFGFQIGCWTFAWILLAYYFPGGYLRISDPAVLVQFWSGLYLIYPTIIWLQGQTFAGYSINFDAAIFLLWLHGLFILGFIFGHVSLRKSFSWVKPKLNINNLPNGWVFFLVPFGFFMLSVLARFLTTGALLPRKTYADSWYEMYTDVTMTRAAGGFSYLLTQINNKIRFYPSLIQGIGAGLIIVKMVNSRENIFRNLLLLFGIFLITLFLGYGGRSGVIMVYLIGLILADLIIGPIPWRYLALLFFIGLFVFEFYGYFRGLRNSGVEHVFVRAYQGYFSNSSSVSNEFSGMLVKEAEGLAIFENKAWEGLNYILHSFLMIAPSQIMPEKMHWGVTTDVLSQQLLRKKVFEGQGVAGAIIVDGYRFAGTIGIPLLGVLLGGIFAIIHNVLTSCEKAVSEIDICAKLALLAGFYSWTFNLIRADFGSIIITILYYVIIPLILIRIIIVNQYSYGDKQRKKIMLNDYRR